MRYFRSYIAVVSAWGALSAPVQAHPHIFVDIGFVLRMENQLLTGIEVIWKYDEFYSLLIFEDLELDADFDGELTKAEMVKLRGFDLNWSEGYVGDTYLTSAGKDVKLAAPEHLETTVSDGMISTRHVRPLVAPIAVTDVVIRAYDPDYYIAYRMTEGVKVTGCLVTVEPPDLDKAYSLVEELLYAMPTAQAEAAFPKVGKAFADTVRVSCGQ